MSLERSARERRSFEEESDNEDQRERDSPSVFLVGSNECCSVRESRVSLAGDRIGSAILDCERAIESNRSGERTSSSEEERRTDGDERWYFAIV